MATKLWTRWTNQNRRTTSRRKTRKLAAVIESLESRTLLSTYTPAQIGQAYGLNQVSFGSVTAQGQGQTIAIVDFGNDTTLTSDVQTFDSFYGLPQFNTSGGPTLTFDTNVGGGPTPIDAGGGYDAETAADVEWAHAIAPLANIVVVESDGVLASETTPAINAARSLPGVSVVSMSFGPIGNPPVFSTLPGHNGVTFVASSGDTGSANIDTSSSPNVVVVGGTSLSVNPDGSYAGESAWSGSGGGIATGTPQPSYQIGKVNGISNSNRVIPDVSILADPNGGVEIYTKGTWLAEGGTSISAPMWAGIFAIIDEGLTVEGLPTLDGATQTLPMLYNLPASDFHDITTGSNGAFSAGPGYDAVTGLGSPVAPSLIADMIAPQGDTIYVDSRAVSGLDNGNSWNNAYTSLQQALAAAQLQEESSLKPISIYVGQGTYTPGTNRTDTFSLINDVTIRGGYAGYGSAFPSARNIAAYTTTLSGDIGVAGNNSDNSYNVVTGSSISSFLGAVLDGFTISGGNANGTGAQASGGGLYVASGAPTILNCTFTNDTAVNSGGAVFIGTNSAVSLTNCAFTSDSVTGSTGAGGGMYSDSTSSANLANCTFTTDTAAFYGGGMYSAGALTLSATTFSGDHSNIYTGGLYSIGSSASLTNCIFNNNSSIAPGGAMYLSGAATTLTGCTFTGNTANSGPGGAIANFGASPTLTNCSFISNSAGTGGAIWTNGGSPTLLGCIFSGNTAISGGTGGA
ncbi:MAG TPA: hypothetical protein VGG44_08320, partial [Tepidisphaeraceae bacterium]